jgi:uncharacterized membrane protein YccC
MALTELAAHAATTLDGPARAMLLAADDYSAVSGRVPLSNLYERGRSLGIGVQVSAQSWQGPVFATAANVFFIPLLAPANQMTYDTQQFYNNTLAVFSGMGAVMLALVLLPPLSPAVRARRLLALTLRDLRRLAAGRTSSMAGDWEGRAYHRLATLPEQVEPLQLARIVAAVSVGTEIIRLRHIARRLGLGADTDARSLRCHKVTS